jgi:hypothetical protein
MNKGYVSSQCRVIFLLKLFALLTKIISGFLCHNTCLEKSQTDLSLLNFRRIFSPPPRLLYPIYDATSNIRVHKFKNPEVKTGRKLPILRQRFLNYLYMQYFDSRSEYNSNIRSSGIYRRVTGWLVSDVSRRVETRFQVWKILFFFFCNGVFGLWK